ncbi:hypothetical protein F3Y22_tig00110339pilonHSYRG00002 [Hibiscus syriacus]|uniref:Starch synthase catalytic domain-containing protein n=1 Tax=Hibiscus syriacus TaxID=106335 RepID=A0A6A3AZP0_HIBSY|nr:hypothetical protein F3Y22_tig00110339pilonHSYRG00002 [Hibiscus syriacus]
MFLEKVAFCIHNISYQGRFPFSDFSVLNLPNQFKSSFNFIDGLPNLKGRKINWMKVGILESDRVLIVSPYYAQELISGKDKGVELDNIIRKTCVTGIVNGMDVMDAKPLLKEALQAEMGLPCDNNVPVIGFIGMLEEQKGSDIFAAVS